MVLDKDTAYYLDRSCEK